MPHFLPPLANFQASASCEEVLYARPSSILTSAAGSIVLAAIFFAPWAFGSRPYFWSGLLAGLLSTSGLLWIFGLCDERRRPRIPAWCVACILFLGALLSISLLNPSSSYVPSEDRFVADFGFIAALPSTVDVTNSLPSAFSVFGMLVTLLVAIDLSSFTIWRHRFLATMALSGVSVIFAGLLLKTGLFPSIFEFLQHRPWAQGDIFGPFDYHGNAGAFINLVIPAMAIKTSFAASSIVRVCWLAALALAVVGALVNTSRVGLVLTVLSVPAAVWIITLGWIYQSAMTGALARHHGLVGGILTIGVAVAAFFISGAESKAIRRLGGLRNEVSEPWYPRYQQNRAAWELAQENPWFGNGVGSYRLLVPHSEIRGAFYAPSYRPGQPYTVLSNTHNDYLQTLVEWGWTGLLGWLALVSGAFYAVLRFMKKSHDNILLGVAIAVALAAVYLHAIVDCPLQIPALQLYAAIYIGLAYGTWRALAPTISRTTRRLSASLA